MESESPGLHPSSCPTPFGVVTESLEWNNVSAKAITVTSPGHGGPSEKSGEAVGSRGREGAG